MNEAETRAEHIDPALKAAGWGVVEGSRILREYNPWLRRYSLTNKSGKSYLITLPKEGFLKVENLSKSIPGSETFFHDTLRIDQVRW